MCHRPRAAKQSHQLVLTPVEDDTHGVAREHGHDRRADYDQAAHLEGEIIGNHGVDNGEGLRRRVLVPAEEEPQGGDVPRVVQVLPVRFVAAWGMLRNGVHERVPRLHVLEEKAANACGQRIEVALLQQDRTGDESHANGHGENRSTEGEEPHRCHLPSTSAIRVAELEDLEYEEHHQRGHLFQRLQGYPVYYGHEGRAGGA
mmetsp:Transcript_6003/g.14815  ORF Transcript_6003/g.14815 Transcript_6003/m.14815 type:complete len:202 (+) Transcript_6003:1061-1666(+)